MSNPATHHAGPLALAVAVDGLVAPTVAWGLARAAARRRLVRRLGVAR